MVSKATAVAVLLAVLAGYQLAASTEDGKGNLPSWTRFHLGRMISQALFWADQTFTPPQFWIAKEMTGFATSKLLYIACELKLADILSKGPLSGVEIAEKAGTDPDRTERVMKFLSVMGVFERSESGVYRNTARSEYLRSDHPQSQHPFCRHLGYEVTMAFQYYLPAMYDSALHPFKSAFNTTEDVWEIFENPAHLSMRTNFDQAMLQRSLAFLPSLVSDYPWALSTNLTVVDIGGGIGHAAAAVVRANPSFKGVIFDLENSIKAAKTVLPVMYSDVSSQISYVTGSFFEEIPISGDVYILKHIIHDWNDEDCIKILKNIAKSFQITSKSTSKRPTLLIIDSIYDYPPKLPVIAFMDMVMVSINGKERSLAEFEALLGKSGLKVKKVHESRSELAMIECELA